MAWFLYTQACHRMQYKEYIITGTSLLYLYEGSECMAVINVTPLMNINALIASDNVNEGDVLLLEEGIYFQTVNVQKSNIRIAAKGPGVIFDGRVILFTAFTLSNVVGVVIEGINIRNYRFESIIVQSASGNRIIKNSIINNPLSDGIRLVNSSGNLIWKNEICRSFVGISLSLNCTNNWIIENIVKEGFNSGYTTSMPSATSNGFISNTATENTGFAANITGSNNLVFDNKFIENGQGILMMNGNDPLVIGNKIKGLRFTGYLAFLDISNHFVGENHISCNGLEGIENLGQFGMFINNELSYNRDTGIKLDVNSARNLIMYNKLVCNIPANILDSGTDNNFINNIDKPCEPCESPSDVCVNCSDEET